MFNTILFPFHTSIPWLTHCCLHYKFLLCASQWIVKFLWPLESPSWLHSGYLFILTSSSGPHFHFLQSIAIAPCRACCIGRVTRWTLRCLIFWYVGFPLHPKVTALDQLRLGSKTSTYVFSTCHDFTVLIVITYIATPTIWRKKTKKRN